MPRYPIAEYTQTEFDVLRARLARGRDTLRNGGALLQSVARAYYLVYVTASFLAGKYGVTAIRKSVNASNEQQFSHSELPALVYALYSGNKRETVQNVGSTPGIVSGTFDENLAYRKADALMRARVIADYGPTETVEPYGVALADSLLNIAQHLVEDLETLL